MAEKGYAHTRGMHNKLADNVEFVYTRIGLTRNRKS